MVDTCVSAAPRKEELSVFKLSKPRRSVGRQNYLAPKHPFCCTNYNPLGCTPNTIIRRKYSTKHKYAAGRPPSRSACRKTYPSLRKSIPTPVLQREDRRRSGINAYDCGTGSNQHLHKLATDGFSIAVGTSIYHSHLPTGHHTVQFETKETPHHPDP